MEDVISIPNVGIKNWYTSDSNTKHYIQFQCIKHAVTVNIGVPIVDMPGCVKYHPDAKKNREQPNLKEEDSQGTRVLCDADYPTYDAMDYTPEDLNIYVRRHLHHLCNHLQIRQVHQRF